MKFTWKKQPDQLGEDLYINSIKVGGYAWNTFLSKASSEEFRNTHRYSGKVYLPDCSPTVFGAQPEDVKDGIEKVVTVWFAEINRNPEAKS